jgi:hypothetical protein
MLKATTYPSPSRKIQTHPPHSKLLVPCWQHTDRKNFQVRFSPNLLVGPARRSAALKVCNTLIDKCPMKGAIDSGATDHFLPTSYRGDNHQDTSNGMQVKCANDSIMTATSTDVLSLSQLPPLARGCHKFDDVTTPLISVGKLCDNNLFVLFSQNDVTITDDT